jgi:diguanylate cyclase (GGDEF)-like protein/PAS domain S-box-containing protein
MNDQIVLHDLLLDNASLREKLHSLTQINKKLSIYKRQFEKKFGNGNEGLIGFLPADITDHKWAAPIQHDDRPAPNHETVELRLNAELRLRAGDKESASSPVEDALKMMHELQVHQIELEMQNEALREANIENERVLFFYNELLDYAPICYLTLAPSSEIKQINLEGTRQLELEPANLIGQLLSDYVIPKHQARFRACLARVSKTNVKQKCELSIQVGKQTLWFSFEARIDLCGMNYLVAMTDITEQKQIEEALQKSKLLVGQAEIMGNIGHFCWDLVEDKLISCSDQYAKIFDMTVSEALDCFISTSAVIELIHPDDIETFKQSKYLYNGRLKACDVEYRITTRSGNKRHLLSRRQYSYDDDGLPLLSSGTTLDITTEKNKEIALKQATEAALEANNALVFQQRALDEHAIVSITDLNGNITYVNDRFCAISGYDRAELIGMNHRLVKSDEHPDAVFIDMWETISSGQTWHGEIKNTNKFNKHYWVQATIVPTLNDEGKPFQYVGIRTEITERKQAEKNLKRMAHFDLLTELPNRALLSDRLSDAMMQSQRSNQSLAVAYLDLDGFKEINDAHGHHVGDELLITVSQRMKSSLGKNDTLARVGGDEFIAVIVNLDNRSDKKPALERLLKAASDPVLVDDSIMHISTSIGVTLYPQDGSDAEQLIRHADQAMYVAKQAGKNRYHVFDTVLNNEVKAQLEVLADIDTALEQSEFVLHYQPKVNMRTSKVMGVEALIRWQHPELGLLQPLSFLPALEGEAISLVMGEWVIDSALTQINQWQKMGINLPISVNISAFQLQQDNFPARLTELMANHPEVGQHSLELEILETSELSNISKVINTMAACHALGVRFALDDFGTGYSSLTHLKRLPAYLIKIDQSFVRNMLDDTNDLAIIEGVIGLAKTFKREVIAEGVETIAHGSALLKLGCELAQGYGIARPMPADDVPQWINNWKADDIWQVAQQMEPPQVLAPTA